MLALVPALDPTAETRMPPRRKLVPASLRAEALRWGPMEVVGQEAESIRGSLLRAHMDLARDLHRYVLAGNAPMVAEARRAIERVKREIVGRVTGGER